MTRIGLLGGSFDPVHVAHLALARAAQEALALDELRWVPVGQAWQKQRVLSPAEQRCAMVSAAIEGVAGWRLERCEVERGGPSYTVDTVRELQAAAQSRTAAGSAPATWYLVIGQDQYANLHTWHDWPDLIERVVLAVAARGDRPVRAGAELAARPHRHVELAMPPSTVSSTVIRARLGAGEPAAALVPDLLSWPVARYIDQHGLYRAAAGAAH